MKSSMVSVDDIRRIFSKIEMPDNFPCWIWKGHRNRKGYGQVWFRGRAHWAHRLVYELLIGPLEPRIAVHHTCGQTYCVNPRHLDTLTVADNTAEGNRRRGRRTFEEAAPF
jgi:hypothetical protein